MSDWNILIISFGLSFSFILGFYCGVVAVSLCMRTIGEAMK